MNDCHVDGRRTWTLTVNIDNWTVSAHSVCAPTLCSIQALLLARTEFRPWSVDQDPGTLLDSGSSVGVSFPIAHVVFCLELLLLCAFCFFAVVTERLELSSTGLGVLLEAC